MKFFTVLLFAVSFSAFPQQQFNDLKVKNLELINETPSSVVITDDNKKTRTSTVSASELEGLSGVTGNIQEQIDAKVNLEGDETISGVKTFSGKIVSTSTTGGNSPCPPHDQASIDSLVDAEASDCVFNTTTKNLNVFDGTIWKSAGGGLSKWEEGKVFNLDDVVVYDNAIYRCVSAHTSSLPFEEVKWELISGDTVLNGARVKNVVAEKVIQTANDSFKIETDTDNLFTNGDFQAQNVMLGWQKGPGAGVGIHTTAPFAGNQSLSLQFVGSDADFWRDITRPEYVGRMARITLYYKSSATWTTDIPQICTFIGSTSNISSCSIIKNTGGQWGLYQSPNFYWSDPKVGLIIKSNGKIDLVNEVLLGRARLELDKNEGFVANIEGGWHQLLSYSNSNATITATTDLSTLPKTEVLGNSELFRLSSTGITPLRDIELSITFSGFNTSNVVANTEITLNGVAASLNNSQRTGTSSSTASLTKRLTPSDVITLKGDNLSSMKLVILAKARSQVTVFPDETFSTDINPVYWKATACGENEIGCYNTYSYVSGTLATMNICSTRPTSQTDADMRINGIKIFTRPYNAPSDCNNPARFVLRLPKNLGQPLLEVFKNPGKSVIGSLDYSEGDTFFRGIPVKVYDKNSGLYVIDGGLNLRTTTTGNMNIVFSDGSVQNNGYITISASKTGLGMANVPARYPVKFIESGDNWATVYSDGWVEQAGKVPLGSVGVVSHSLYVPMSNNNYTLMPSVENLTSFNDAVGGLFSSYTAKTSSTVSMWRSTVISRPYIVRGWGASSVVKQYGVNPAY